VIWVTALGSLSLAGLGGCAMFTPFLMVSFALMCMGCEAGPSKPSENAFVGRMAGCAETVNGKLVVAGGMTLSANVREVGCYDPATKSWASCASIPTPRSLAASAVHGGAMLVVGGRSDNAVLSSVEKYVAAEDKWESCAPMPTARWSLMACVVGDTLYAFGGIAGLGDNRRTLDVVEALDIESNTWQSLGAMPEGRQAGAAAAVDGRIFIISGKAASYVQSRPTSHRAERVDCFDPKTNTWTVVQDIPTDRTGGRAVVAESKIFVIGGICKTGEFPTQIDVFDPGSNEWSAGPKLQSGRSGHMCAVLAESIVVFGGSSVMYGATRPSINATMEMIQLHPSASQAK